DGTENADPARQFCSERQISGRTRESPRVAHRSVARGGRGEIRAPHALQTGSVAYSGQAAERDESSGRRSLETVYGRPVGLRVLWIFGRRNQLEANSAFVG